MPPGLTDPPPNLLARSFLAGQAAASASEVEAALDAQPDPNAAAFFDVDNTLLQGASIYLFARGLHRRKFFTARDLAKSALQAAIFRFIGGEDADAIAEARESALGFIKGRQVKEIEDVGEEIFDEFMADRIWPGTRAIAQWHLDRGQRVWIVTAAPIEIATVIARRLGFTGALGTVAERVDGVYTGALVGDMLHGEGKAVAVRAIAEREDLDLEQCFAYSDSANDIPMLSLVGHPCAINPDSTLREHAKKNGWLVRDYRTGRKAAVLGGRGVLVAGGGVGAWLLARRLRMR